MGKKELIAVCGLDCGSCDIRRVDEDPEVAERIIAWFKEEGWLKEGQGLTEIIDGGMYCKGCRGDRTIHWSPDCWILHCCVDEKGLAFCYECDEFPCDDLEEWAQQNDQYGEALERLKEMKNERSD
jgi:hypothetical protein